MLIDMEAIRQAAKNKAATPCYPANAANAANAANGKHGEISNVSNVSSVSKVATGFANDRQATEISRISNVSSVSKVAGGSNAPPDLSLPRLLALAMALCDRIEANEQERADWQADIEQAAPEHRGHLLELVHRLMPKPPPIAVEIAAPPPKPLPRFHVAQPWRAADRAWLAHWGQCPQCKTAGRTNTARCAQGEDLFTNYQQAKP